MHVTFFRFIQTSTNGHTRSPLAIGMALTIACAHGVDDANLSELNGSGGAGGAAGGASPSGGAAGSGRDASGVEGSSAGAAVSVEDAGAGGSAGIGGAAGTAGGSGTDKDSAIVDTGAGRDGGEADRGSDVASTVDADASCVLETSATFCARLGKNCGSVTANDRCGNTMTASCGTCGEFQICGGGGQPSLCGALTAGQAGTITSSSPGVPNEDMSKAFDANSMTKWYAGNGVRTAWIAYQFGGGASHVVTSYSLTSANDVPGRDPSAWQLQGSNDGQTWTTVDTRTAQTFPARFQTHSYSFASTVAYPRFRLNITANSGGTDLQLAELQLFGQ